jgi:hypothetical protein
MSLKVHSDTGVNATFIHTFSVQLQGPRGNHSTRSVTSQGTAARKAYAPWMEPHQASSSLVLRMLAGRASTPQRSPTSCQQSARLGWECRELNPLGSENYHKAGPLLLGRESLWQGEAHAGESPLMLAYMWVSEDTAECSLLCPQQVSFLCDFSPSGCSPLMWLSPLLTGYTQKVGTPVCCSRCQYVLA